MNNEDLTWSSNFSEELFNEFKNIFSEGITCAQIIPKEKLLSLALARLEAPNITQKIPAPCTEWYDFVVDQNFMVPLISPSDVNEVIFHSESCAQVFHQDGRKDFTNLNLNKDQFLLALKVLCLKYNQTWNYSDPFASFAIEIGGETLRCTLIHSAINKEDSPKVFLRKLRRICFPVANFCNHDEEVLAEVKKLVESKANILVAGSTGSGKTSFLSSLLKLTEEDEHIIALEDTDELICDRPGFTKLLSFNQAKKHLSDYMSYAMRMTPDRIILGEMRSHEVVPFILATNTGHKGLMATVHANSAKEAIDRVATLFSVYTSDIDIGHNQIAELIARNIDYVVFLQNKKIVEIIRPLNYEQNNLLYSEVFSNYNYDV